MLHHIAPKFSPQTQAIAISIDSEEVAPEGKQATATPASLYTVAVVVRIGLVAAILLRALALWP